MSLVSLTTWDGHEIAFERDAVRLLEDAQLGADKPAATKLTLVDGTERVVAGCVHDILLKLETH